MTNPLFPLVRHGKVTFRAISAVMDGTDTDALPDLIGARGKVTFRASEPRILLAGATPPLTLFQGPQTYDLDADGYLVDSAGRRELSLVSQDTPSNPPRWHYTVSFAFNDGYPSAPFPFTLAAGDTVDLTTATPLANPSPGVYITKGDKGDVGLASTVPGPVGPASTVPGPRGADGNTLAHAATHATTGTDPIPPASIGAEPFVSRTGATAGQVPVLQSGGGLLFAAPAIASELRGTGFPEGVVTAPVGTYYTDTAVTNGALRWAKTSGTGNTGWAVVSGNTGPRNIDSLYTANASRTLYEPATIQRVNDIVEIYLSATLTAAWTSGALILPVPTGFRGALLHYGPNAYANVSQVGGSREVRFYGANIVAGSTVRWGQLHIPAEPWPTTLPGTPA